MSEKYFRKLSEDPYIPRQGPQTKKLPSDIYVQLGDEGIVNMIGEFYGRLKESSIAPMFVRDISESVDRSASFFVQLLGGPAYYNTKFGNPRMRVRHLPFRINEESRLVWLKCFYETLDSPKKFNFPSEHLDEFKQFLDDFSRWMVNTGSGQ